ncbi:PUA-like domain-containing protein [Xylariaceae sp. FL1272]|nr:PUA-like domain-containing protein [Xylariaceae sp. FL1272]
MAPVDSATKKVEVANMPPCSSPRIVPAMKSQNRNILLAKQRTDEVTQELTKRYQDARRYLVWLETEAQMTPALAASTQLQVALDRILLDKYKKEFRFPQDIVNKARELQEMYNSDNFGATAVIEEGPHGSDSDDEPTSAVSTTTTSTAARAAPSAMPLSQVLVDPSANDAMFAEGGIMHGLLIKQKKNGGNTYVLNPEVPHRSCKVFGHNGLQLGAWFPFQISALHHGAHGATTAGIAGDTVRGAYSIVVAGSYDDLDEDLGNTLYYSAPNSHENRDPQRVATPTTGSKALKASWAHRQSVRVLRSGGSEKAKNKNGRLPKAGLRYDGLYMVVACNVKKNTRGGLYEQFRLERDPDQYPSLASIRETSPTQAQLADYSRMRERYAR